jgi:hypothetical protein
MAFTGPKDSSCHIRMLRVTPSSSVARIWVVGFTTG